MTTRTRQNSWSGDDDEAIRLACDVVCQLEPDARLCADAFDITVTALDEGIAGCASRGGRIFISPDSKFYRLARMGDALALALIIHHEQFHVMYGPDEAPAYAASLRFLERSGIADLRPDLLADVEGARDQALAKMDRAAFHASEAT